MKIKEINRANVAVASNKPKRNRVSLECIARVCAVVTFFAVLPAHHALADADDKALAADRQSIQQQLNALKAQVASLQGSDTALTSQVSGLQTSNTALQAAVATLKTSNSTLQNEIGGLQSQITSLQTANAGLQGQLTEARNVLALAPFVSVDPNPEAGVIGPNIVFKGVNVHLISGSGATNDNGNATGLGNLILGYDELPPPTLPIFPPPVLDRGGSHNLVIGRFNGFTKAAFGGLVAGESNTVAAEEASVTGGLKNTASGPLASVTGRRK